MHKKFEGMSIEEALQYPFPSDDIEWRISRSGFGKDGKPWAKCLAYVTARAVQERLDEVFGVLNWEVSFFVDQTTKNVLCTITVKIDSIFTPKQDGAEPTEFESYKGGLSSAMKRAAVQWGIGRYLYKLEENYAIVDKNHGDYLVKIENEWFKWNPPELPSWALPELAPYTGDPKEYVPLVGKYQGKKLGDIDPKELETYFLKSYPAMKKSNDKNVSELVLVLKKYIESYQRGELFDEGL